MTHTIIITNPDCCGSHPCVYLYRGIRQSIQHFGMDILCLLVCSISAQFICSRTSCEQKEGVVYCHAALHVMYDCRCHGPVKLYCFCDTVLLQCFCIVSVS